MVSTTTGRRICDVNDGLEHDSSIKPNKKRRRGAKARAAALENQKDEKHAKKQKVQQNTSNTNATQRTQQKVNNSNIGEQDVDKGHGVQATATSTTKKRKTSTKKKDSFVSKKKLKPGDEGYKTKTQLRNASKRRAKQRAAALVREKEETQHQNENKKPSKITKRKDNQDPSSLYMDAPERAPVVLEAKRFMTKLMKEQSDVKNGTGKDPTKSTKNDILFRVTTPGLKTNWRTVSKLAVRRGSNNDGIQIGLFQPKSHNIAPMSNSCEAHHPSINMAICVLQRLCDECDVFPYDESSGQGELRYVAINVERSTGACQVTLVWNGRKTVDGLATKYKKETKQTKARCGDEETEDDGGQAKDDAPSKLMNVVDSIMKETKAFSSSASSCESDDHVFNGSNRFKLHSLWVHYHTADKHTNAIFGRDKDSWDLIYGADAIEEVIDSYVEKECLINKNQNDDSRCPYSVPLQFPPNVFRQANIDAFSKIVGIIRHRIAQMSLDKSNDRVGTTDEGEIEKDRKKKKRKHPKDEETSGDTSKGDDLALPVCLELYGGVGTIGLHLLDLLSKMVSSDENPYNVACFERAVKRLPNHLSRRALYLPLAASDVVNLQRDSSQLAPPLAEAHICIVDPPRKGLDDDVIEAFLSKDKSPNLRLLIYVSCGFRAFKRDCSRLLSLNDCAGDSGSEKCSNKPKSLGSDGDRKLHEWNLEHAEGFVLFPGSDAIETVAFFVRK